MKFDVTTSKLYQQIMDAATSFFGLDKDSTTETEIHAAMDGQKPLAEQLDSAKTAAIADLKEQFDTLKGEVSTQKDQITALETRATEAEKASEVKDKRITALQLEIQEAKEKAETMEKQHKVETEKLAGELAKSKAGKNLEVDAGGDSHDAAKKDKGTVGSTQVIVAESNSLKALVKKRAN